MNTLYKDFIQKVDEDNRSQVIDLLDWVESSFPSLEATFKWNQPMFLMDGTFIIGFSVAKKHISIAPERRGMEVFEETFKEKKVLYSKMMFKFLFQDGVDYDLLKEVIEFNMMEKKGYTSFWR